MSAFGTSPLGTELGPLGGPGLITVLGVLPSTNNSVVLVYDREPDTLDPISYYSATNADNYELLAVDPTYMSVTGAIVPKGQVVPNRFPSIVSVDQDDEDPTQVELFADTKLEPGVEYIITVVPRVVGANCEVFAGEDAWSFVAPQLPGKILPADRLVENYRDIAFGTLEPGYMFDATGDLAIQSGVDSLRKRLYRRLFSRPGDFAWTTKYGVGLRLKALAKANMLQGTSDSVREQFLREPDVQNAAVSVSIARAASGTFIDIRAVIRRQDQTTVSVQILEPLS